MVSQIKSENNTLNPTQATIDLQLDLGLTVTEIGAPGRPANVVVQIGEVAVVSHNQEAFDQDGLPDIYLDGEVVTKSKYLKDAKCLVARLAQFPGELSLTVTQRLAGISLTDSDLASASFLYHFRLENPYRLLSREANWMTVNGQEHLRSQLGDLINSELNSTLADQLHLWTSPDIREVSGGIFARLDNKLKSWGLGLDSEASKVSAFRKYPQQLYEIVLQFKSAEENLLKSEGEERQRFLEALGFLTTDLVEMKNFAEHQGKGAGLFMAAKNIGDRKDRIEQVIKWLESGDQKSFASANFLRNLYAGKAAYTAQDTELTERVVLATFRNIRLGFGEWGDADQGTAQLSQYREMDATLGPLLEKFSR